MRPPARILPLIVIAQFLCTSLWFSANAIADDIIRFYSLGDGAFALITSSVQLGFIIGTLTFAIFSFADRYAPSMVFFVSAIFGALANMGILLPSNGLMSILLYRFLVGFFLAGIYPIGMKIAADYYKGGLGKSLGFLLAALVIGTASPHALKAFPSFFSWSQILLMTSGLAFFGGLLMYLFVPSGPFCVRNVNFDYHLFLKVFEKSEFRSAANGYFGHMWELYAFWAFVPLMIMEYNQIFLKAEINIYLFSFIIIASGSLSSILAGYLSVKYNSKSVATAFLGLSFIACLFSPLSFLIESEALFLFFLIFWGMVVIPDSPLFSSLVAQHSSAEAKGTALTIVNCIGFAISILSIQLISWLTEYVEFRLLLMLLALGPLWGLLALLKNKEKKSLEAVDQ